MRALLVLLLLFVAGAARAETLAGTVIVVIDGDTVLFKPDRYRASSRAFLKVRLAGIDAPETDQPYGEAATRALKVLALKRQVRLDVVGIDVYGRRLGLLEANGVRVNEDMVRHGHAWASSRATHLRALQKEARQARRGLWRQSDPVPPWTWRHAKRPSPVRSGPGAPPRPASSRVDAPGQIAG